MSNGHLGMGGYDIYLSRRENSLLEWGAVENLGYPINSFGVENSATSDFGLWIYALLF